MTVSLVPSPLGLFLRHGRQADPSADEVLILSYNHDLGFLERTALGVIQQTGARITIVGDASVARHDLYAIRHAGTAYLPGVAHCPAAFHPKVLVVAGREAATVAIGSGNLTLAGWQGNDELWTVHHADQSTGSAVVAAVGEWLIELATTVKMSEGVPEAFGRAAPLLTGLAGTDTTAQFVSSLRAPIIDQLPKGPVDELLLYAPFHDPGAQAVAALLERFTPRRVAVAVQPGLTEVNGPALAAVLPSGAEVVTLSEHPYRHGKLIEWATGGTRWALTGSANLSRAALLRTTAGGGNVEVGVIAPTAATLFPEGAPLAKGALAALPPADRPDEPRPSVSVLSAVRTGDGVRIRLAGPMPTPGVIQLSPAGTMPDHWQDGDTVEHGGLEAKLTLDAAGGSRVRIRLADGSVSKPVFVIDPERILRVRTASSGGPRPPELEQVLTDPKAAEQLWGILDDLRRNHGRLSVPAAGAGGGGPRPKGGSTFEVGDWEEYLERCQGRMGAATMAFAFGIPLLATRSGSIVTSVSWDDEPMDDDDVGGLEDDDADEAAEDEPQAVALSSSLNHATEEARRRFRAVAEKVVRRWADPEPHERLLALRLVLVLVAAGAWSTSDDSWADLVLDATSNLETGLDVADYEEAAGSLAALGLSVVQSVLPPQGLTPLRSRFERTAGKVAHLLVGATKERIAAYATGLEQRFPASSDPVMVMERAEKLIEDDPLADAVERLMDQDLDVTADGRVVRLDRAASEPLLSACRVLAETDEVSPLVIQAPGKNGWATLLWRRPDLVTVRSGAKPGTFFCVHYRYTDGAHPSTDIRSDGVPASRRRVAETPVGQPLTNCAVEILAAVGLTGPVPA